MSASSGHVGWVLLVVVSLLTWVGGITTFSCRCASASHGQMALIVEQVEAFAAANDRLPIGLMEVYGDQPPVNHEGFRFRLESCPTKTAFSADSPAFVVIDDGADGKPVGVGDGDGIDSMLLSDGCFEAQDAVEL